MDGVGFPSVDSGVELLYGVEQFGVEVGEDAVDVELPGCGFAGWAFGRLGGVANLSDAGIVFHRVISRPTASGGASGASLKALHPAPPLEACFVSDARITCASLASLKCLGTFDPRFWLGFG